VSAALDEAVRTRPAPGPLAALLSPRSVAVVGASSDPTRIGGLVVDILKRQGFAGPILPINPSRDEIQGLKAWPSVAAAPGGADLAVIAVPAAAAMQALDDCAAAGVGAAVMLTAGLAETGEPEGVAAQAALVARAREAGIRLLGPNCAGLANFNINLAASFHPAFRHGGGRGGRIALAAQSGAFGGLAHHEATLRGLSLGAIVTTGNEADVQISDCIEHFVRDPAIEVILAYVESVRDGPRFIAALEAARAARKPVVMVKVGDSEAGMRAAASHTGALAAPSAVMAGLLRQHGVIRARSIEELFSLGYALDRLPLPRSRRLGVVTGSGGVGVLLADDAASRGLEVAPLSAEVGRRIKEIVPYAGVSNPVDVTGQVLNDPALFERVMKTIADEDFGALAIHTGISTTLPAFGPPVTAMAEALRLRRPDLPLAFVGYFTDELRAALEAAGCACFAEPTHATRALAALADAAEVFARPAAAPPAPAAVGPLPSRPREADALRLAAAAGIPVTPFAEAEGPDEAAAAAARLGLPAVLKVHAASVAHKSDLGGVALGLTSPEAVRDEATAMTARLRANGVAEAEASSFLVAPMARGEVEVIVGMHRDPVLGPVVMVGLGGVDAEAMRDVAFRVGAIGRDEARRMIAELGSYPRLLPHRTRPGVDLDALASAVSALSRLAVGLPDQFDSFEINPLFVGPEGVVAVDALLGLGRSAD
tara:strand:- start:1942 stop:4074 length:2133 start_codon:yes stop_codon:yes gene_type:complete